MPDLSPIEPEAVGGSSAPLLEDEMIEILDIFGSTMLGFVVIFVVSLVVGLIATCAYEGEGWFLAILSLFLFVCYLFGSYLQGFI